MQATLPWDDFRLVLAIARSGTLAGAARALSVSHATVFRRLEALETRVAVRLFERGRGGYTPTIAGQDMADAGARIEAQVHGVERRVVGRDLRPSGTVRLTTTDTLFDGLLAPMLEACRCRYPDIALEVALSNEAFNLSRRDADMAIRPIARAPEALIAQRLGTVSLAVYGPRTAAVAAWQSQSARWIGLDEGVSYPALARWMAANGADMRCDYRLDSILAMRTALRHASAVAVLPCYLGDSEPGIERGIERWSAPLAELDIALWLLIHPDLRRVARIRAIRDWLIDAFAQPEIQQRLAGGSPA